MGDRKIEIKQLLKQALEVNLSGIAYRAFIFGSQANLQDLRRADIDVGIIANTEIPLGCMARLNSAFEDMPMLYKVDLVDFNEVNENFRRVAMQNVEWL